MIDPATFAALVGLGVWAALDTTSVGQFMISRPLVVGTFAGVLLGDPATGLLTGALLEGIHLADIPSGGAQLPEPGPAAVPAALAAVTLGGGGGLALGVLLGVLLAILGGRTLEFQRRLNVRLLRLDEEGISASEGLDRHLLCIGADALRGGLLTLTGLAAALSVPGSLAERWPLELPATSLLLLLPGVLAAGVLLRSWSGEGRWREGLFLAGVAAGVLGGVML